MALFRSEPMSYVQINVSNSAAHDTVRSLGGFGKLHLVDLSHTSDQVSHEQLVYKRRVHEFSKMEREFEWFIQQMNEFKVEIPHVFPGVHQHQDVLDEVNAYLTPRRDELTQHLRFLTDTDTRIYELLEHEHVLRVCKSELVARASAADLRAEYSEGDALLGDDDDDDRDIELSAPNRSNSGDGNRFHQYLCGIIPVAQQNPFSRMLFRCSRGNALVRFFNLQEAIIDPKTGQAEMKSVFYVVVMGRTLNEKICALMSFFYANMYEVPERTETINQELERIKNTVVELREVHTKTQTQITQLLKSMAFSAADGTSPVRDLQIECANEKAVFVAMTKGYHYLTYMTLEGWVPNENIEDLKACLLDAVIPSGLPAAAMLTDPENPKATVGAPPTYFKTGDITSSFQDIVNTYGVPRYGEVNPGLFTIITFPFLFGIMYGDIGHGLALTLAAFYMVYNEKSLMIRHKHNKLGEIMSMVFMGRYLLLFMGLFAVYCGFIYNDCLSVPLSIFSSTWSSPKKGPADHKGGVYPFGVDPAWYNTTNELTFFNSLKMKISVSIGVIHMMFGIFLGLFNHIHFKDRLSLLYEFIPMVLFMSCTFGYMVIIILYKFCVDWSKTAQEPPNLIQTMINMFLQPGVVDAKVQLYPGQAHIQAILVSIAFISIPVMMFAKPLVLRRQHRSRANGGGGGYMQVNTVDSDDDGDGDATAAPAGRHHDEFDYSETQIHQLIHTIEFVLGAVSNTASYLRLWALSLAHAELSTVFWEKLIVEFGLDAGNPFVTVISFGTWVGATCIVLLSMDVLECFLHALRLHWVEFQNKFFYADGYLFVPFAFNTDTVINIAAT